MTISRPTADTKADTESDRSARAVKADDGLVGTAHPAVVVAVALSCAVALIARFFVPTPLWLDEALSVNIAQLPLADIPEALRSDGHPPLYYFLLHGWMQVFGDGDQAVRAMSGLISLAALPFAYLAGRRVGGARLGLVTVAVLSLSPFFLRYGSETRMYSLIILLVFAGFVFVSHSLETPTWQWLAGSGVATAALLWTHYWSFWLIGSVVLLLAIRIAQRRRSDRTWDRPALATMLAMLIGGLAFLPWLPSFIFQAQHTGTPWAESFRPATLVVTALTDFSGGPYSEMQLLMLYSVLLLALGLFASGIDRWTLKVDLHTQPDGRVPAIVAATTVVTASIFGMITQSAFAPRYASVFFPFFVLILALGIDRFRGRITRSIVIGAFLLLSLVGLLFVFQFQRSQAEALVEVMADAAPVDAMIVACPDQLGPSIERAARGTGWEVLTYPRFESAERVDWVDYADRNALNNPEAFAAQLLDRAGDRTIFVTMNNSFLTLENQCSDVIAGLAAERAPNLAVEGDGDEYFEPMTLYVFDPAGS